MYHTDFLQRLGIESDADERAVKRAYARELKLIDQERDAAGFQLLREAYEGALRWVKHKQADPGFAPSGVAADQPVTPVLSLTADPAGSAAPAPMRDNPQQLAEAVFGEFLDAGAALVAQGHSGDVDAWRKRMAACVDDERLLNLSARAGFEYLVAHLLAEGWRPGHEGLFMAARLVFGWDEDGRRLQEFGQPGAWLNQAIDESAMFIRQDSMDCSGQSAALQRVREAADPGARELLTHGPHLQTLRTRFPVWTATIASAERITRWIEAEQALPAWRRRLRFSRRPKTLHGGTGMSGAGNWWKFVVAVVLIRALVSLLSPSAPPAAQGEFDAPASEAALPPSAEELEDEERYRRAAGALYIPPDPRRSAEAEGGGHPNYSLSHTLPRTPAEAPAQPGRPAGRLLNGDELNALMRVIDYHPAHPPAGKYMVEFELELGPAGQIATLRMQKSSGLQVLDKKVEQAIRAGAPFPPELMRRSTFQFQHEYRPRRQGQAPAAPGNGRAPEASR